MKYLYHKETDRFIFMDDAGNRIQLTGEQLTDVIAWRESRLDRSDTVPVSLLELDLDL